MRHNHRPESSGIAAALIILLVVLMIVAGVAGVWIFRRQQAMVARELAMAEQARAVYAAERAAADASLRAATHDNDVASIAEPETESPKQLTIYIDQRGKLQLDGKAISLDELQTRFDDLALDDASKAEAIVYVDRRSTVEQLLDVIGVLESAGVSKYRIDARQTVADEQIDTDAP